MPHALKLYSLITALAAMALVLFITFSNAQGIPPDARGSSGMTVQEEATVLMVASGVGALKTCTKNFKDPKYELTGKAIFFNKIAKMFAPYDGSNHPMTRLANEVMKFFGYSADKAVALLITWDPDKKVWGITEMPMDSVEKCDLLESSMRAIVTVDGNPFGDTTLEPYKDGDA